MTNLNVKIRHTDGTITLEKIYISNIKNLGMSYRDPPNTKTVEEHLKKLGTKDNTPDSLPTIGPKPNNLITTDSTLQVTSSTTAGEAEFVMYPTSDQTYIGVGNDHKEYNIMPEMGRLSNSTCPSVVSEEFWIFEEISDHWDKLELKSWVERDGLLELYQQAPMSAFMRPDNIVDSVNERTDHPITGSAIWSGTVSRATDSGEGKVDPFPEVISGDFYLIQLYDPVLDRRLVTQYEVRETK